jgi:hypothetical protein
VGAFNTRCTVGSSAVCALRLWFQDGSTPLLAAVAGSHDSIVKALLDAHADVNAVAKVCGGSMVCVPPTCFPNVYMCCAVLCCAVL